MDLETYEGKVRAKVKFINSTGGMALKNPLDQGQAKAFAAKMKAKIAAFDAQAATAGTHKPAPKNGATKHDDGPPLDALEKQAGEQSDDIPF